MTRRFFRLLRLPMVLLICLFWGCGGSSSNTINTNRGAAITGLNTITTLSSTSDTGYMDRTPRALAFAPAASAAFPGDGNPAHVQPGDLVVANLNERGGGAFGNGTTVDAIRNGQPVNVFAETGADTALGVQIGSGLTGIAFAPNGDLWVACFRDVGGVNGGVQIVTPGEVITQSFNDPKIQTPWGLTDNGGFGGKTAFFTSDAITGAFAGTVSRINVTTSNGVQNITLDPLTPDLGHSGQEASSAAGPQGMVHAADDTLYIADGAANSIVAIPNSSTAGLTSGRVVYQGAPLNQPAGMTLNPTNGDLIVANRLDGNLVEITTGGKLVGTKAIPGGSAGTLSGVLAATDGSGGLKVYFCNDNTNTVQTLSK